MDVSIAVSLIRGQMGTVVERAVNVAVETVLAEMLKVVGVKFEELKAQVVLMKKEMTALQREKGLKEKENDNIRAKLRYTELKLKYYRQGVEEELQQRTSTSTLVRIHPPTFTRGQRGEAGVSPVEASPSVSVQRSAEGALMRSNQVPECTSSQSESRRAVRVRCPPDMSGSDSPDLLLPVTLTMNTPAECLDSSSVLFCPSGPDAAQRKDVDQEDVCEWTVTVLPHADFGDSTVTPPPGPTQTQDAGQQSTSVSPFPDLCSQADGCMLPSSAPQVKQEVQSQHEEEEEVICIKEEPEEEQEVMATLLLNCQVQQDHPPGSEAQRSGTEWLRLPANQMNPNPAVSSAGPITYGPPPYSASLADPSATALGAPPRQVIRPWPNDLSLYEEYKLRRNELRRRNLNRRRELEKSLPQPLLADLVRERREKTRLRVARWRAKRKLQACLNQAQAQGDAAGLSQTGFPASSEQQQQQLTALCASSSQQRQHPAAHRTSNFISNMSVNAVSAALPLIPSSSSSPLLLRGPNMAPHEHTVTSSSSSYRQVGQSQQSISLTDSDLLQ